MKINKIFSLILSNYKKYGMLNTIKYVSLGSIKRLKLKILKLCNINIFTSKYGFQMKLDWNDVNSEWMYYDQYGNTEHAKFLMNYNKPFNLIDIGANYGYYSLLSISNQYCKKVICFEPVNTIFKNLNENFLINNFDKKKFALHNFAISKKSGNDYIFFNPKHSGASSLNYRNNNHIKKIEVNLINHVQLNQIISKVKNIIIKIDVEGHEEIVINEIFKCAFSDNIDVIIYECNDDWSNEKKINDLLKKQNFKYFKKFFNGSYSDIIASKKTI